MPDRDKRFDAMRLQFLKYLAIKLDPFLVGLVFHSRWIQPRPRNRHSEDFESHFRKERDILFPMMIEVCRFMIGIIIVLQDCVRGAFWKDEAMRRRSVRTSIFIDPCDHSWRIDAPTCRYIAQRRSSSPFIPSPFLLIGSRGATP